MEILKINENKKLEIYDMKLNLERARQFREEQCEKIKFLQIKMQRYTDFLNMLSPQVFDLIYSPCCCDLIFGCKNLELVPQYAVYTYSKEDSVAVQKNFLTQYVTCGLNQYPFQLDLQRHDNKTLLQAYLFLVLTLSFENGLCVMDQVVSFPNEVIVLYLLEHGDITTALSFLDSNHWENVVSCFDFCSVPSFSSSLAEAKVFDAVTENQKRTIALHKNIVQHMKTNHCY